jgi:threonine dehydratase
LKNLPKKMLVIADPEEAAAVKRLLGKVRRAVEARDRADAALLEAIVEASEAGASLRLISRATGGSMSHERVRSTLSRAGRSPGADH